uniref:DNA repair protein RAD51 homolog 3 n=1 Tax=Trichuris muris TaxID=70415 RepID=A0A5S6QLZ8_TRIMR
MIVCCLLLSLQLAVDARIPEPLGGVNGEVVYVDTEGTFRIRRLEQIARFAIDHCRSTAESEAQRSALDNFTMEKILSGIYVYRCTDLDTFRRCVSLLQDFVCANKKVKLIIVDSVAMHLREQFASAVERTCIVKSIAVHLLAVALRFNVAIFLTNQVTTKWTKHGESYTAPSLGPILTSNCGHQLYVYKKRASTRYVRVIKSTTGKPCTILMDIGEAGIRDALEQE